MRTRPIFIFSLLGISALLARADLNQTVQPTAQPFPLAQVQLLDGPFKSAMELDGKYLLSLSPDRLLSWYRKEAGLKPLAPEVKQTDVKW